MRKKGDTMSEIKASIKIIEEIKNVLNSHSFMESNRNSEQAFTRKRKLPFFSLILFHLNLIKQSLQKELTEFMKVIGEQNVTKSAFCQQRLKLKSEAFIQLNEILVKEFYTDNVINEWNEYRLTAIDGSTLELPKSDDILATFGYVEHGKIVPMARISTFYDLLNNVIIDSQIASYNTNEYSLALEHLKTVKKNDLIIFDSGYGSIWLFYYLVLNKINFVIRIQRNFISELDSFWESNENSKIIELIRCPDKSKIKLEEQGIDFKPFKIRAVKVLLENGEKEVLITSLLDEEKCPTKIFKKLYFKRWGIEVNYDHLKNHIELGNFTGKSSLAIRQDFFANMLIANMQTIIARDAQGEMDKEKKETKYEYKENRNLSLGFMKDRVLQILTSNNPEYFKELKELFKIEPVPIRENRTFYREQERKRKKFHMNKKRAH